MEKLITDFFQHMYEVERAGIPEFRIHAWQDKVAWAFLNPTDPDAQAVMMQEGEYVAQRSILNSTYEQVLSTVMAMPESLQPATLVVLSGQIADTLTALGLDDEVRVSIVSELGEILQGLDTDPEDVATVVDMLQSQAVAEESTE